MTAPDSYLPASAKRLKSAKADLWERARGGAVGGFAWEYTYLVDQYFSDRILEAGPQRFDFVLLAVGGYGRGRLCPGSDVDILLLFKRRIPRKAEEFVKTLLFPLWDLNLDLGHGVRTISDCISLSQEDFQVLASLLDTRPLAGNAEVFEAFKSVFDAKVLKKKGHIFAESLREHNRTRAEKYGDATGMLEPELKNGLGGLRDGQQVMWLSRVLETMGQEPVFLPEEIARMREDQAFLNRVRTALHLSADRKTDQLYFDLQPPTAKLMGFASMEATPEAMGRGVEFFLSRLHQAMTRIKVMREAIYQEGFPRALGSVPEIDVPNIAISSRGLFFASQAEVTADNVLDAFLTSAKTGVPLSWSVQRLIRRNPGRFASQLIDRSQTLHTLVEIFSAPHAEVACSSLLETRLLPAIFPEFGDVEHLIQFNDYHVHPVGRHTMATIGNLAKFLNGDSGWAAEIAATLNDPSRLILAGFFHDLGKGESDHSTTGAAIAFEVLSRFGVSPDIFEEAAFLVEHHLLIPKAATRRDLSDERVAADVATTVGSVERLNMLYLLSVADSMATGPRAWNNWTQSLFAELYFKVKALLERGPYSEPEATERHSKTREEVMISAQGMEREFVESALDAMPSRAFLALNPSVIVSHIELVQRLWNAVGTERLKDATEGAGEGINLIEVSPGRAKGTVQLTIAALDRTGLFATMAGAIALHGMNILAADLFTWKDGTAVDVFTVSEPSENVFVEEVWERVSRFITASLSGRFDLADRIQSRRRSPLSGRRSVPQLAPIVSIDNESSHFYTLIEVAATDRIGFLFDMARVLARYGLSIHLAKITTIKGRAADIFHVRDEHGQKVYDEVRLELVRRALVEAALAA